MIIGFCNDFGFFDWFLGGGRSSNSVVFGGTCKKWTCSTMTSWRKVANMKSTFFDRELALADLFVVKVVVIYQEVKVSALLCSPLRLFKKLIDFWYKAFLITPCFDRFFFRSCFFLLNSRVPVSQPVEQVSSRRGHGTEVASSHFLRNSLCQIFSHVYLDCSSFLSWISSMLRGRAGIANSWLLTQ